MSVEQQIALLEAEKYACAEHFDAAIANLRHLSVHETEGDQAVRSDFLSPPSQIEGKPLSQTILEDRGAY